LAFGPVAVRDARRRLNASAAFGGSAQPAAFKMIGFDPLTGFHEVWIALGAPSTHPPSGHTLSNIAYVPLSIS
jgi:hypothetical protein